MKFGKLLKETTEGMGPEMTDLFVRYKELKKYLKAMKKQKQPVEAAKEQDEEASHSGNQELAPEQALSPEETAFVNMLNEDLLRFNRFFIDKEEDSVIKLQSLADRIAAASSAEQLQALKAELVDFHGEMVLLLHWSLLNYAAVVKILKKHDKRSGLLLRAPYLANVLQQPFYSTSVMSRLVKMAEEHINRLVDKQQAAGNGDAGSNGATAPAAAAADAATATATTYTAPDSAVTPPAAEAAGTAAAVDAGDAAAAAGPGSRERSSSPDSSLPVDTAVFARTRMALQTWDQLCSNASTPSTVLPAGSSELVRQLKVRERWARLVGVPPGAAAAAMQGESQGPEQQQQQQGDAEGAAAAVHEAPALEDEAAAKRQRC